MTKIANPIADSAAATVKIIKANNCPKRSSIKIEKIIKLKLIANNINSIDINKMIIFFLFKKIPLKPIKNKALEINR